MKFKVFRTSDRNDTPYPRKYPDQTIQSPWIVDINSLEDLLNFQRSLNYEIIIEDDPGHLYPTIEIYDTYRE